MRPVSTAALAFLLALFAALASSISLMEVAVSWLDERTGVTRWGAALGDSVGELFDHRRGHEVEQGGSRDEVGTCDQGREIAFREIGLTEGYTPCLLARFLHTPIPSPPG